MFGFRDAASCMRHCSLKLAGVSPKAKTDEIKKKDLGVRSSDGTYESPSKGTLFFFFFLFLGAPATGSLLQQLWQLEPDTCLLSFL